MNLGFLSGIRFRRGLSVLAGAVAADPVATLVAKFVGTGTVAGIQRIDDGSGTYSIYYLRQQIYQNLCFTNSIEVILGAAVGTEGPRTAHKYIDRILKLRNRGTTPAMTVSGAGWTTSETDHVDAINQSLGLDWDYSDNASDYAQLVTDAGITQIYYVITAGIETGGVMAVTIDGDKTLATSLPTAQSLVDGGSLASSALVANGGPFNPTDRVLDLYANRNTRVIPLATALTAGAHTVRVTRSGQKNTGSSGTYIFLKGFAIGKPSYTLSDTGNYYLTEQYIWQTTTGDYPDDKFAYAIQPTGTTGAQWIGHTGSVKLASVLTLLAGGSPVSLNHRESASGASVSFACDLTTHHTEVDGGATSIGTLTETFAMDASTGLTISTVYTLAVGGSVTGYPTMMTVAELLDRATYAEATQNYALTDNDNSEKGDNVGKTWVAWDTDGYLAALHYIPDLATVANWATSGALHHYFLDANGYNKAYAVRFSNTAFSAAAVWSASANFRAQWFPSGANASLTK